MGIDILLIHIYIYIYRRLSSCTPVFFFNHANVTLPKGEASAAMVAPAAIPVVPVAQSADDAQGSCGPSLHSAALLGSQSVGEGKPVGKLQLASAAVCSTHAMGVTSEYLLRAASMLVHAFHHLDNSIPCITG